MLIKKTNKNKDRKEKSDQLLQVSLKLEGRLANWAWNSTKTWWDEAVNGAMLVSWTRRKKTQKMNFIIRLNALSTQFSCQVIFQKQNLKSWQCQSVTIAVTDVTHRSTVRSDRQRGRIRAVVQLQVVVLAISRVSDAELIKGDRHQTTSGCPDEPLTVGVVTVGVWIVGTCKGAVVSNKGAATT